MDHFFECSFELTMNNQRRQGQDKLLQFFSRTDANPLFKYLSQGRTCGVECCCLAARNTTETKSNATTIGFELYTNNGSQKQAIVLLGGFCPADPSPR
jgi:hypothetical protein